MTTLTFIFISLVGSCCSFLFGYFCGCWQTRLRKVPQDESTYYIMENPLNHPARYVFIGSALQAAAARGAKRPELF